LDDSRRTGNIVEAALLTAGNVSAATLAKRSTRRRRVDGHNCGGDAADWTGELELRGIASGWRFLQADLQSYLDRLTPEKPPRARAAVKTWYRYQQPMTRGDIEAIRGVAVSTSIVKTLEDRQWSKRHPDAGRPALYATTKTFLDDLGLRANGIACAGRARPLPPAGEPRCSPGRRSASLAIPVVAPSADRTDATAEPGAATDNGEQAPLPILP
jgi:segregation and condensation protein B